MATPIAMVKNARTPVSAALAVLMPSAKAGKPDRHQTFTFANHTQEIARVRLAANPWGANQQE
jgi:hypothetical protein